MTVADLSQEECGFLKDRKVAETYRLTPPHGRSGRTVRITNDHDIEKMRAVSSVWS